MKIGLKEIQVSIRATVAAVAALLLAQWGELQYPIYAFIAAVIVTDLDPQTSRNLGWRRLAATAIGAICGALLTRFLPPGPWSVGTGIFSSMLLSQLMGAGDGARVAGYIGGIVLLDHAGDPWSYAWFRFLETTLGVVMAWAVSYVPKLFRDRSARKGSAK